MKNKNLMLTIIFGSVLVMSVFGADPYSHLRFDNDPEDFRFAIVPDRTGGDFRGAFTNALEFVNLMRPEFVMTVGDLIPGLKGPKITRTQQIELTNLVSKVDAPFFYVVGNHDIPRSRPQYPNNHEEALPIWKEFHGEKTYYSFMYKGVLILCLDTMQGRDAAHADCKPQIPMLSDQYDWIRKELADHAEARWTLIFMHQPAVWNTPEWRALEDKELLNRKYTVFAGDWHQYLYAKRNGHDYYVLSVAGGGSANAKAQGLPDAQKLLGSEWGEFDHITWVTMQKDGPHVVNLRLDGYLRGDYLNQSTTLAPQKKKTKLDLEPKK